jgi:hypothetical protein
MWDVATNRAKQQTALVASVVTLGVAWLAHWKFMQWTLNLYGIVWLAVAILFYLHKVVLLAQGAKAEREGSGSESATSSRGTRPRLCVFGLRDG